MWSRLPWIYTAHGSEGPEGQQEPCRGRRRSCVAAVIVRGAGDVLRNVLCRAELVHHTLLQGSYRSAHSDQSSQICSLSPSEDGSDMAVFLLRMVVMVLMMLTVLLVIVMGE